MRGTLCDHIDIALLTLKYDIVEVGCCVLNRRFRLTSDVVARYHRPHYDYNISIR